MRTPVKLVGFGGGLALAFGVAAGVGQAVGPTLEVEDTMGDHSDMSAGSDDASTGTSAALPGGLMVSQDGYTLRLGRSELPAGPGVSLTATILDAQGAAVTAFDVEHEKELHLIAVRRDGTGFQHVHPVRDAGGTWSTELDLQPGPWRVFADFAATGAEPVTLGADLAVAGDYQPVGTPQETRETRTDDGYTVSVEGDLVAGEETALTLTVEQDGVPVTDLDPYLGAYGHLVALRDGDLAYLHVHPDGEPGDGTTEPGPGITFYAEAPSAGTYRLFLDFQHQGVVRTAPLTLTAGNGAGAEAAPGGADSSPGQDPEHDADGHAH